MHPNRRALRRDEYGTAYITLGSALIQQAGITQIQFGVRVQKSGPAPGLGAVHVTDNEELALIDDAAAAGAKRISASR